MEPDQLPEFVHDLAEWTQRSAAALWSGKAALGSPFYWPPGVANPNKAALELRQEVYDQTLRRTGVHAMAHAKMVNEQQKATHRSYQELAAYHATTLRQAKLLYVGKDVSYLAARTEMKEFRLDLDLFYLDPVKKEGLMTCGFIMWDTPIGEAEPRGKLTAQYDARTGELIEVDIVDDMMEGFRDAEGPINAVTWRILPGAKEVLVVFYTDGTKARKGYEQALAAQAADLPPGMVMDRSAVQLQMSDMQPLEREQVLPLNKTLAWFEQTDEPERLMATILSDPSFLREAERHHVAENFVAANEKVLPMLSQMVKTFVATLAIRRMKLAQRDVIVAPRSSVKRMRRGGAEPERQEGRTELLRIGKPLTRRASAGSSGGGGKWKVKTVIGPVIRTRQYVPAYDEYREGVWMIEPYVAGPEDAPWSRSAKVFLLE